MFTVDEIPELQELVSARIKDDQKLLKDLRLEVRPMASETRVIKPRSVTSVSLVASDGGNNKLSFDPYYIQLVRVVDSYGKRLFLDTTSQTTDTDKLSRAQFDETGEPRTALGRMMKDLGVDPPLLSRLSPMIPSAKKMRETPEQVSPSWVQTYRDICEWAVLYDILCYHNFATDTLIVRDGPLRSKIFAKDYFVTWRTKVEEAIDKIYQRDRRHVYLVGVFKHSKVYERYQLAMAIEQVIPPGEPRYVRVPREIEAKAYVWPEYARGAEVEGGRLKEAPKFVAGDMFLVRFGSRSGDPIWAVDIFSKQSSKAQEIFGYLLADAIEGFPVPFYPRCLQNAHEHAEVVGFDYDLLQDEIIKAIRNSLTDDQKTIIDALRFNTDVSNKRYE